MPDFLGLERPPTLVGKFKILYYDKFFFKSTRSR